MFDIGFVELMVIGVVALIVVGPKDLPGMFRTLGSFTAKARAMAREFQRSLEAAADESGVGDIAGDLKKASSIKNLGLDSVKDAVKDYSMDAFDPEESRKKIDAAKKIAEAGENTKALAAKRAADKAAVDKAAEVKAKAESKPKAKKPATKNPTAKKPAAKKEAATKPKSKPAAAKKPVTAAAKKPAAKKASRKAKT